MTQKNKLRLVLCGMNLVLKKKKCAKQYVEWGRDAIIHVCEFEFSYAERKYFQLILLYRFVLT